MHAVVHVEIPVSNMKRAKEWYGKVFGWTFQEFDKTYTMWNAPGGGTGGALYLAKKVAAKSAMRVYIEVADVEAALKQIRKARGKVVVPKKEVPTFGWWAAFTPPQGTQLYLWQPAPRP